MLFKKKQMGLVPTPRGETDWLVQTDRAQPLSWNRTQGKATTAAGQEAAALTGGDTSGGDSRTAGALLVQLGMIYRPCWSSLGIQFVC